MANDSSAVFNILAFNFVGQGTARETVKQIRSSGALEGYKIAAEAIVEHDQNGKVHIHEPGKDGEGAAVGAQGGGILGFDWIILGLGVFADWPATSVVM